MNIKDLKFNDHNPRKIGNQKFKKLVKSIKQFPEMLDLRPIVINPQCVVLGGNMRLKACIEAGLTDVPVIVANLTEDQEKEFIVKDNLAYGNWDFKTLTGHWELKLLKDWGVSLPIEFSDIPIFKDEQRYDIIAECVDETERTKIQKEFENRGFECRSL